MHDRSPTRRDFIRRSAAVLAAAGAVSAEGYGEAPSAHYAPTWESLDSHPCPAWFRDAKLGMYFHWGPSSVPGWAPRAAGIS